MILVYEIIAIQIEVFLFCIHDKARGTGAKHKVCDLVQLQLPVGAQLGLGIGFRKINALQCQVLSMGSRIIQMVVVVDRHVDHAVGFGFIRRQFLCCMVVELHLPVTDDHHIDMRDGAVAAHDPQCQCCNENE